MLTGLRKALARDLFSIGCVQFDTKIGFDLKFHEDHPNWPKSPIYLHLRTQQHPVPEKRGPLDRKTLEWVGIGFRDALEEHPDLEFDLFADIPDAGTPFGDQIAQWHSDKVRLTLIKTKRPDGTRFISGIEVIKTSKHGNKVLLVDDLVTGAATKLEAIKVLEAAGYEVVGILVLVDRCTGGTEELEKVGYRVISVMTLPEMLDVYVDDQDIDEELRSLVLDYPRIIDELRNQS